MRNLPGGKSNQLLVISLAVAVLAGMLLYMDNSQNERRQPALKIGVLHSLTGAMASSEAPLVDAVRLAVEEANQTGGVDGRHVEMIVADCRSEPAYCAQQAEQLITRDGVQALFGCWTSACRKAVKKVVEKHHHLLFYPLQYEGLEQSRDIFYTGATPNQQMIPMALWALQHKGKRFYLIGTDYIYPHTANLMAKDVLLAQGGQLLGERYVPMEIKDMAEVVKEIGALRPDFVLNTLNGDSNRLFFRALHEAGIGADTIPVFSTSIAEVGLTAMEPDLAIGHYAAWNYFQSLDTPGNRAFVERFKQRFGKDRVLNDPMMSSYVGVKLWLDTVREQGSNDIELIKTTLAQQTMLAPQGIVAVDYASGHLWQMTYIGSARADGQFDIVWQSAQPVRPEPFPFYRSRAEWLELQRALPGAQP